jgi:hypothetical protein
MIPITSDIRNRFPSAFRKARVERIRCVRLEPDLYYVARRAQGHGQYMVRFFNRGADVTAVCGTINNERCKGTFQDRCCVHIAAAVESGIKHGRKSQRREVAA